MFRNRHFEVKIAKDGATPVPETDTLFTANPEQIVPIVTEAAVKTIVIAGSVIAANRVLKTICEVAVVAARAKFK